MTKMTLAAMTTVVLVMIAAGCSSQSPDLVGTGQVGLEKNSARGGRVELGEDEDGPKANWSGFASVARHVCAQEKP